MALRTWRCTLGVALLLAVTGCGREGTPATAGTPKAQTDARLLSELQSLGYVDWAEVPPGEAELRGVTRSLPGAFQGPLFYHSRTRSRAWLLDAHGRPLHTWRGQKVEGGWHHAELLDDGDLMVIRRDGVLLRIAPDSSVRWQGALDAHHDLSPDGEGGFWVLTHALGRIPFEGAPIPIVDDFLVQLDAQGQERRRIPLRVLLGDAIPRARLEAIAARPQDVAWDPERPLHGTIDVFHTNTVERLPRDVPGLGRAGQLLIAARELDTVAVVDPDGPALAWRFGPGVLDRPHQPTLRRNGHVLVFDNGASRGWSRIVEVDPVAREVVWEYRADPPEAFFSEKMGGVEELPNGNVLVTESARGHAFEVTSDGRVVWEFWNPEMKAQRSARAAIHRLRKLAPGAGVPAGLRSSAGQRGEEAG